MLTMFKDDLARQERCDIARTVTNEARSTAGKICPELRSRRAQHVNVN